MHIKKPSDYCLLTYYCPLSVSNETHDLIRKLPAFITNDPTEHCHFYVEPISKRQTIHSKQKIKNTQKYGSRSQRMLNLTKTPKNNKNTKEIMRHTAVMSMLKEANPHIESIQESKLKNIIKPLIDTRADINTKADKISYFLLDKDGIFEADHGHHIDTIEQFHFGGDYGANYKGSLFNDPEVYKIKKMNKHNTNKKHNTPKRVSKVCHGCRHQYFEDEWDTHILTDPHQGYLSDPAFTHFTDYIDALNARLKQSEKEDNTNDDVNMMPLKEINIKNKNKRKRKCNDDTCDEPQQKKRKITVDLPLLNDIETEESFDDDGFMLYLVENYKGISERIKWPILKMNNTVLYFDEIGMILNDELNGNENKMWHHYLPNVSKDVKKEKREGNDRYLERMRSNRTQRKRKRKRRYSLLECAGLNEIGCCRKGDLIPLKVWRQNKYFQCSRCDKIHDRSLY